MTLLDCLVAELGADRVLPQPGWSTATRPGRFAPVAVMLHWTAARSSEARPVPALGIVRHGTGALPGPLYHLLVGYDGRVRVIHRRLGNHAGRGSLTAVQVAQRGDMTHGYRPGPDTHGLNTRTFGVSMDYHPDQGAPPAAMLDGMVGATVALHRWMGWDTARVLDHMNATRRKRDNDTVPQLQAASAGRLAWTPPPAPAPIEEDDDVIHHRDSPRGTSEPRQEVRDFQFALNRFFTDVGGGPPSTGWLVKDGVAGDQTFAATFEALHRLQDPRWAGESAFQFMTNGRPDLESLHRDGIGPVVIAAIVAAAAVPR